jgi:hypothetical protein
MHKAARVSIVVLVIWLVGFYGYALSVMASPITDNGKVRALSSADYWFLNPSLIETSGSRDKKFWKWREFLGCGSMRISSGDDYNYARWSPDQGVEVQMLTRPELDWVYVAGVSVGSAWDGEEPSFQPTPLEVSKMNMLILETRIDGWKGAPLSPIIFPSWYAVLSDVWFNVTNVRIEDENGTREFSSKVLGIDVFYHTMTGSLNAIMGGSGEFARIEPCNKNFIYSVNLAGQDFFSQKDGMFIVDLNALLRKAQGEAEKLGWYFDIENAELVMLENVIESYWSYIYARIGWSGIRYCLEERECM